MPKSNEYVACVVGPPSLVRFYDAATSSTSIGGVSFTYRGLEYAVGFDNRTGDIVLAAVQTVGQTAMVTMVNRPADLIDALIIYFHSGMAMELETYLELAAP